MCVSVQLYKGGQSVWATGTDRGDTKPTTLNVQVTSHSVTAPL